MTRSETSLACIAAITAALATLLFFNSPASAAESRLEMPDFSHLQGKAVESVDITLDGFLLRVASRLAETAADEGDKDAEVLRILSELKSVQVRNFEFAEDGQYSADDIEKVRRQLAGPDWSQIVQQRKREPRESVDVYLNSDGRRIYGIAVVAIEPRSFTIVHIVGNIDVDKLAKLEGQFNIPRVTQVH